MPPKKKIQNILWFKTVRAKTFLRWVVKMPIWGDVSTRPSSSPGFAVTTHAFDTFIERGRVRNKIVRTLSQIPPEDMPALEGAGRQIRDLIESTQFLQQLQKRSKKLIKN